jgi:hypothetical protein
MSILTCAVLAFRLSTLVAAPLPQSPTKPVRVLDVHLGRGLGQDMKIRRETATFAIKDTVYASIHMNGDAPRATIHARWTYKDGQVVDERTMVVRPRGEGYVEFHVMRAEGWLKGKYALSVQLDGKEVRTKTFTVK